MVNITCFVLQGFPINIIAVAAPQLTVVSAPSFNQALERMRGTPSLRGWCPPRRWHMKRQQFSDRPAMIGDPSGYRRGLLATCPAQTLMWRAKVIDGADQVHPMAQRQCMACQRPAAPGQRREAFAECRVQPLDVGRINHPVPLRSASERLYPCRRAIDKTAFGLHHPPPLVALDHLGNQNMAPWPQAWSSALARLHRVAKGLPNSADVGHQAIGAEQQRTVRRTAPDARNQAPDQRHVALLADLTAQ